MWTESCGEFCSVSEADLDVVLRLSCCSTVGGEKDLRTEEADLRCQHVVARELEGVVCTGGVDDVPCEESFTCDGCG